MAHRTVLGLAGYPGTGKSFHANILADEGFYVFEGSSFLAKSALEQEGLVLAGRDSYQAYHRRQQERYGPDWLGQQMLKVDADQLLFSGLRVVANAQLIRRVGGRSIALECPAPIAFERMDRSNPKNPQTLEEYYQHCALDDSSGINGEGTRRVTRMAEHRFDTSAPIPIVSAQIAEVVAELAGSTLKP